MATKNDITGDALVSKANTKAYEDNWERIFGKKDEKDFMNEAWDRLYNGKKALHESNWPEIEEDMTFDEDRADIIGQNGNIGYDLDE